MTKSEIDGGVAGLCVETYNFHIKIPAKETCHISKNILSIFHLLETGYSLIACDMEEQEI
jgi:hypothetical protein